jgi:hypothetical protein
MSLGLGFALAGAVFFWYVLGCAVLAWVDDDRWSLYSWAATAPNRAVFILVVLAWPLVVWRWHGGGK